MFHEILHADAATYEANGDREVVDLDFTIRGDHYSTKVYGDVMVKTMARMRTGNVGRYTNT
jgi:hypothetical protein